MNESAIIVGGNTPGPVASNDQDMKLWMQVIAPGAPIEQARLVYHYARMLGLDPLRKQIMLLKTKAYNEESGGWVDQYNILVGIHGMNSLVSSQPDYAGQESATVYNGEKLTIRSDGTVEHEYDPTKRQGLPLGAWASVVRVLHGKPVRFTIWLPFDQIAQRKARGGELRAVWASRPDWMAEKTALAFADRKAYPHILSNVYAPEEFGGYSRVDGSVMMPAEVEKPKQLDEGEQVTAGGLAVDVGLYKGDDETPHSIFDTETYPHPEVPGLRTVVKLEMEPDPPEPIQKPVEVGQITGFCKKCTAPIRIYYRAKDGKPFRQCETARKYFLEHRIGIPEQGHFFANGEGKEG